MKAQKVVKAKVINLTNRKRELIDREHSAFNTCLKLYKAGLDFLPLYQNTNLYVQTKRQIEWSHVNKFTLWNWSIRIEKRKTKISKYWLKFPVYNPEKKRGKSIWVALAFPYKYDELLTTCKLRDSKVTKKGEDYYVHLVFQKEIKITIPSNPTILAVDLGEKRIATSVEFANGEFMNPKFYGKEVRGIRRHYAWLRKRLGEKKLLKVIKRIGHTEQRKVNDILHKISSEIVKQAKQDEAIIVVGDLKGIQTSVKGKRFNRIVHSMPYFKLTQYIEYKAFWNGILVVHFQEMFTSKNCSVCSSDGKRPHQSVFTCNSCGLKDFNADLNSAKNIAKRFSGNVLENGALLIKPLTNLPKKKVRT